VTVTGAIDAGTFAGLVDALYAGTFDDAAWNRSILAVADVVRASGAVLMAFDPSTGAVLRAENFRVDLSALSDYQRYWSYQDCRLGAAQHIAVGCPVTERSLELPGWRRSAILNEFLLPADVPYFMPAWLCKSPAKAVTLSFQGTRKRGPFAAEDLEAYRQVLPHITRALEIRDRLQRAHVRADTLAGTLDSLTFGVLVLDAGGRLLETNCVAARLLRTESCIGRRRDGTLWLRDPAGAELTHWIRGGAPPKKRADGLLHVPRPPQLPLSALVTPLPPHSAAWMAGDPRWLLLIFDPERRVQASAEFLAHDLGISAREAEVAALLVAGLGVQKIAVQLGISIHTVRTQLKSVFGKTGLRSQADVIRRAALGPSVLAPPGTTAR
jgi:DNA-binding CsgD family transcriptional regulator